MQSYRTQLGTGADAGKLTCPLWMGGYMLGFGLKERVESLRGNDMLEERKMQKTVRPVLQSHVDSDPRRRVSRLQ